MQEYQKSVPARFRFAVPNKEQLKFFGDTEAEKLFFKAVRGFEMMSYNFV